MVNRNLELYIVDFFCEVDDPFFKATTGITIRSIS